jgi:hypothetical protein
MGLFHCLPVKISILPAVVVFMLGLAIGHVATRWMGSGKNTVPEGGMVAAGSAAAGAVSPSGAEGMELETRVQPIGGAELLDFAEGGVDRDGYHGQIAALAQIEGRIAASDFNSLSQAVSSAPPGSARETALRALVKAHAVKDPAAVLAFAGGLENARERDMALRTLFSTLARNDPSKAVGMASGLADSEDRAGALGAAVSAWASQDTAAALAYVASGAEEGMRPALYRDIAMRTRANHRQVFEAVVANVPSGSMFEQSVYGVFSNWARENPREAAAALAELPGGSVSLSATMLVARQWAAAAGDKKSVFDWARGLPEGDTRTLAMDRVFENWGRSDAPAALLEFDRLPAAQKQSASRALAAGWGRKDPEAALGWAQRLSDSGQKTGAMRAVVGAWAKTRPQEAARRVSAMPPEERAETMTPLVESWASLNAEDAAKWLMAQPAQAGRDGAVLVLSNRISREDPEAGFSLAAGIADPQKRQAAMVQIGREWMRGNSAEARRWIGQSTLPESVRSELLK